MNEYFEFYQKWTELKSTIEKLKNEIYGKEELYNSKSKKKFEEYGKKTLFNRKNNELLVLYKRLRDLTNNYDMLCHERFSKLYSLKYNGAKFEDDNRWEIPYTTGQIERVPSEELLQELRDFESGILAKLNTAEPDDNSEAIGQIK